MPTLCVTTAGGRGITSSRREGGTARAGETSSGQVDGATGITLSSLRAMKWRGNPKGRNRKVILTFLFVFPSPWIASILANVAMTTEGFVFASRLWRRGNPETTGNAGIFRNFKPLIQKNKTVFYFGNVLTFLTKCPILYKVRVAVF